MTEGVGVNVSVLYRAARSQVMFAVAALSDPDYQQRVWIRQEVPHPGYHDSLDMTVHTLFDDCAVLPNPRDAVGTVLVDGPEIERLNKLGQALDALIDDLKERPDDDYVRDRRWGQVIEYARDALSAMVLADPGEVARPEGFEPPTL
jgi:hypothetical protein